MAFQDSSVPSHLRPFIGVSHFRLWSFLSPDRRRDWLKTFWLPFTFLSLGLGVMVFAMVGMNFTLMHVLWISSLGIALLGRVCWFAVKCSGAHLAYQQEKNDPGSFDRQTQEQASALLARRLGDSLSQTARGPVRRARL